MKTTKQKRIQQLKPRMLWMAIAAGAPLGIPLTMAGCGSEAEMAALQAQAAETSTAAASPGDAGAADRYAHFVARFDTSGDGVVQVTELPARMQARLAAADTNSDGALSQEELETFMQANPPPRGRGGHLSGPHLRPEQLVTELDANKDGLLQITELPTELQSRLAAADTSGDGVLSTEELTAAALAHRQERFAKMDKNSDGAITEDEVEHAGGWAQLSRADADSDSRVTFAELEQAMASGNLDGGRPAGGHPGQPGQGGHPGPFPGGEVPPPDGE